MQERITARTSVLLLVFVVLGVYYPAIFSPINSVDDPGMITYLLNVDSFNLREIFTPGAIYYRPLLLLSFIADKYLWGLQESFMHLENVLFHLVNVLLLFVLARRVAVIRKVNSTLVPLCVALLFALHPINSESVNWISGRTDPLACMFVLLSALFLFRPSSFPAVPPAASVLCALSILAACLAKETSIFFLPAAMLFPFFVADQKGERGSILETALKSWPHLAIMFGTGLGFLAFRRIGSHAQDAGMNVVVNHVAGPQSAGNLVNLKLLLKAAGFYLKKLFVPFPLNFGIIHVSDLYLAVGVLVCLLGLWLLARRTLTAYFFLCALSVSCSAFLIPMLNLTWTPLAERYMYLPSTFFALGCVFGAERWELRGQWRVALTAAFSVILLIGVYGSATRTLVWQDNLTLYQDTVKKSPDFIPAQNELATALYAHGKTRQANAVMNAMQVPASLINYQYALIAKALVAMRAGDLKGGEQILEQALREPGKREVDISQRLLALYDVEVQKGIGTKAEYYPRAVRLLTRLHQLTGDAFYLYRLGTIHLAQKERKLARESFLSAAAQAPASASYRLPALKLSQKLAD
ncbi:MAG TPA: hypothetical protein VJ550_05850 [Geomonas sp.]|nr:hypothetical protein [Geomonas sp.]